MLQTFVYVCGVSGPPPPAQAVPRLRGDSLAKQSPGEAGTCGPSFWSCRRCPCTLKRPPRHCSSSVRKDKRRRRRFSPCRMLWIAQRDSISRYRRRYPMLQPHVRIALRRSRHFCRASSIPRSIWARRVTACYRAAATSPMTVCMSSRTGHRSSGHQRQYICQNQHPPRRRRSGAGSCKDRSRAARAWCDGDEELLRAGDEPASIRHCPAGTANRTAISRCHTTAGECRAGRACRRRQGANSIRAATLGLSGSDAGHGECAYQSGSSLFPD